MHSLYNNHACSCEHPGEQHTNLSWPCGFLGPLPSVLCEQSRLLCVTMILSKRASSGIIITYMRLDLDGSFAVHTTCSVLSLRFFNVKVSVFLEPFIRVSNELVTFHEKDNVLLCVFQRCYVLRVYRLNNGPPPT